MKYVRVYADATGASRLEDVVVPTQPQPDTDPNRDLLAHVSAPLDAGAVIFRHVVREGVSERPHTAPRRQFLVLLSGRAEVQATDGETRVLGPGDVLLAEDTTGLGHLTRALTPERTTLVITLAEGGAGAGGAAPAR